VVEDNEVNQVLTVAILTRFGDPSDVAGDGRQAVELVPPGSKQRGRAEDISFARPLAAAWC
jgi:CheY-like chemotaxis protein